MQDAASVWTTWIQLGFAGFSLILIGVIIWLTNQLLKVLRDVNKKNENWATIVAGNTQAIVSLNKSADETKELMVEIKNNLLSRPCLLPEDVKEKVVKFMRQTACLLCLLCAGACIAAAAEVDIASFAGSDIGAKCNNAYLAARERDVLTLASGNYQLTTPIVMVGSKRVDVDMRGVQFDCAMAGKDDAAFTYGSDTVISRASFHGPWINMFSRSLDGFRFRNIYASSLTFEGARSGRCGVVIEARNGCCVKNNVFGGGGAHTCTITGTLYAVKLITEGSSSMNNNRWQDTSFAMLANDRNDSAYWNASPAPTVFLALNTLTQGWVVRDCVLEADQPARLLYHTTNQAARWLFEANWREGVQYMSGPRGVHARLRNERNGHERFWTENGATFAFDD